MEFMFENGYDPPVAAYLPPGWPAGVHPPDSAEFQQTAVAWLLDVVPPDYRLHGVLVSASAGAGHAGPPSPGRVRGGSARGLPDRQGRAGRDLPAGAVEAVLAAYRSEGQRLVAAQRAADLITRALRGEAFVPSWPESRTAAAGHGPGGPLSPSRNQTALLVPA